MKWIEALKIRAIRSTVTTCTAIAAIVFTPFLHADQPGSVPAGVEASATESPPTGAPSTQTVPLNAPGAETEPTQQLPSNDYAEMDEGTPVQETTTNTAQKERKRRQWRNILIAVAAIAAAVTAMILVSANDGHKNHHHHHHDHRDRH